MATVLAAQNGVAEWVAPCGPTFRKPRRFLNYFVVLSSDGHQFGRSQESIFQFTWTLCGSMAQRLRTLLDPRIIYISHLTLGHNSYAMPLNNDHNFHEERLGQRMKKSPFGAMPTVLHATLRRNRCAACAIEAP